MARIHLLSRVIPNGAPPEPYTAEELSLRPDQSQGRATAIHYGSRQDPSLSVQTTDLITDRMGLDVKLASDGSRVAYLLSKAPNKQAFWGFVQYMDIHSADTRVDQWDQDWLRTLTPEEKIRILLDAFINGFWFDSEDITRPEDLNGPFGGDHATLKSMIALLARNLGSLTGVDPALIIYEAMYESQHISRDIIGYPIKKQNIGLTKLLAV